MVPLKSGWCLVHRPDFFMHKNIRSNRMPRMISSIGYPLTRKGEGRGF